jgi:hypothetical protein
MHIIQSCPGKENYFVTTLESMQRHATGHSVLMM